MNINSHVITLPFANNISWPCFASVVTCLLISGCGDGGENSTAIDTPSAPVASTPTPPNVRQWLPNGGNATVAYDGNRPFLTLIPNLDINQLSGVSQGRELFITNWQPAGVGRPLFDGVGALFNAQSCTSCHTATGRVSPYNADGSTTDGVLFRLGDRNGNVHPIWGAQLQPQVVENAVGLLSEGQVRAVSQVDALNRPFWQFSFTPTDSNQSLGDIKLGARIAPQLLGMGLLDNVSDETIMALADPDDANQDGISGRVHWVFEEGKNRIGRFGWKGINSMLKTQNATAMHQDMGLTSSVFLDSNCTPNQPACTLLANGGSPEISEESLQAIVDFMTALSVPSRRIDTQEAFDRGADVFEEVGCASCHVPMLKTASNVRFKELANQTIYPYTDLLLHDMGAGLDDGVKEKDAQSFEWRTPPLWGIGIVANDTNARFLHDGRAKTLDEAIRWHGGEAQLVNNKYQQLTDSQRMDLMTFLRGI